MPIANAIDGAVETHVITLRVVCKSAAISGSDADRSVVGNELENTPTINTPRTYHR